MFPNQFEYHKPDNLQAVVALLAPDGFVQQHDRVFEFRQARARFAHCLRGGGHFSLQPRGAAFQLTQLALEGQQARALFDGARVARAITPDYALGGHTASLGLCWMPAGD